MSNPTPEQPQPPYGAPMNYPNQPNGAAPGAPQPGYGAPQQGNQQQNFGAPQQGYGAPQQGNQNQGYGAPQQNGGAPQQGYQQQNGAFNGQQPNTPGYPTGPGNPGGPGYPGGPGPTGEAPRPRRRRRAAWIAGATAVVLVGGSVTTFALVANASERGADSAKSAAERIEKAISGKNAMEMAKLLSPSEMAPFAEMNTAMSKDSGLDEMAKADGGDISPEAQLEMFQAILDSFDLKKSDMEYTVTEKSATFATMELSSWNLDVKADRQKLAKAIEDGYKRSTGKDAPKEMSESITKDPPSDKDEFNGNVIEKAGSKFSIALVKEDDRWYISPLMSMADAAIATMGDSMKKGEPNYAADPSAVEGASSPTQAVQDLTNSLTTASDPGDFMKPEVLSRLSLPERRLMMVYGPALMGDSKESSSTGEKNFNIDWQLGEHKINDDLVVVNPSKTSITFDGNSDQKVSFDGAKLNISGMDKPVDLGALLSNPDRVGITTVKENGTWRVSTLGTLTNLTTLRANDEGLKEGEKLFADLSKSSPELGQDWNGLPAISKNLVGVMASFVNGFKDVMPSNSAFGDSDYGTDSGTDGTSTDPFADSGTGSDYGTDSGSSDTDYGTDSNSLEADLENLFGASN